MLIIYLENFFGHNCQGGGLVKKWEKICLIASAVCLILTVLILINKKNAQKQQSCTLCNMLPHHAPCLVDLETGDWAELGMYLPHDTLSGELADQQPYTSYFSFICIGDLVGSLTTDPPVINVDIPVRDTASNPSLCKSCLQLLDKRYNGRYIITDTYDIEAIKVYPIENGTSFSLRCYEIDMVEKAETEEIAVTVLGTLDIKKNDGK